MPDSLLKGTANAYFRAEKRINIKEW